MNYSKILRTSLLLSFFLLTCVFAQAQTQFKHNILFQALSLKNIGVSTSDYARLGNVLPAEENFAFSFKLGKPSLINARVVTNLTLIFAEEIIPNKRLELPILPVYFADKVSCQKVNKILLELRPTWLGNELGESFDFIFDGVCQELITENGDKSFQLSGKILTKLYK